MRKIIIITFLLPLCLWLAWYLVRSYYTPRPTVLSREGPASCTETTGQVASVDGTQIPYSLIRARSGIPNPKRVAALLISDQNRDRNWDSQGLSPSMGRRLARFLGSQGMDSIRFDMRGSGESQASRLTWNDPRLHLRDIHSVESVLLGLGYRQDRMIYLAQGEYGGFLALRHLAASPQARALFLLNASALDRYIESWGEQIFAKMEEQHVSRPILQQAKAEWKAFLASGQIPSGKDPKADVHPDLQAFRNTMRYLLKPQNRNFYDSIRAFDQSEALSRILRTGLPVQHWIGEYSEAMRFRERLERRARGLGRGYRLRFLRKTDSLLREQGSGSRHILAELARALDPVPALSPDFQRAFLDFLNSPAHTKKGSKR